MPPPILAQDYSNLFTGNVPFWASLLALFFMSPVVLSIVNGILLIRQNQQKKDMDVLAANHDTEKSERKQQEDLLSSVNDTNKELLKFIRESLLSGEKRDERYITAINNLDATVGGFGNILQQNNREQHELFSSMQGSIEAQTAAMNTNTITMQQFSAKQDTAVILVTETAKETRFDVGEIKTALNTMAGKMEIALALFQKAVESSLKTDNRLASLTVSIQDMTDTLHSDIDTMIKAVESIRTNTIPQEKDETP